MIVSQHYSGSVEVKAQHVQTELVETEEKHVQAGKLLHRQSVYIVSILCVQTVLFHLHCDILLIKIKAFLNLTLYS